MSKQHTGERENIQRDIGNDSCRYVLCALQFDYTLFLQASGCKKEIKVDLVQFHRYICTTFLGIICGIEIRKVLFCIVPRLVRERERRLNAPYINVWEKVIVCSTVGRRIYERYVMIGAQFSCLPFYSVLV